MPRNLDQVMEQYRNVGHMNVPTPPPPPYVIPNAFQATSYQMRPPTDQLGAMIGSYATNVSDIAAARGRETAGFWGRGIGTAVGFGLGAMTGTPAGAFWGASTGQFLGGLSGTALSYIPGVNQVFQGYQRMRWGGAMDQMASSNMIQQGLYGRVNLPGGAAGVGGTGINPMAALQLAQALGQGTGGPGGPTRQQLAQLTATAAETGFLDTAANIGQISNVVKKLAGVMGEMAKLTGDPDFRNNMRELSNLRNMGVSVDQSLRMLRDMRMYGRMAGGVEIAQAGAQAGAALFQQYGLTPGLGKAFGAAETGAAAGGMGNLSTIERGLYGGPGGVATTGMQTRAEYLGRTAQLFLPYLVERGENGALQINQKRLQELRNPGANLNQFISGGMANLMQMGPNAIQDLMNNSQALQTQMGEQLGYTGTFATMAALARQIRKQNPNLTLESAAGIATGDRMQGVLLARQMEDPVFVAKQRVQLDHERMQVKMDAREQRLTQIAATPGPIGRWWEEFMQRQVTQGGMLGGSSQGAEAAEQAREQIRAQDRALGLQRVLSPTGSASTEAGRAAALERVRTLGSETARQRAAATRSDWQRFVRPGEDPGAVDAAGRRREWYGPMGIGYLDYGGWRPLDEEFRAVDVMRGQTGFFSVGEGTRDWMTMMVGGDVQGLRESVQLQLQGAAEGGRTLKAMQSRTVAQFARSEESLRRVLIQGKGRTRKQTATAINMAKGDVIQYAQQQGSSNGGLDPGTIRAIIMKSLVMGGGMRWGEAEDLVNTNRGLFTQQAYHWVDKSGSVQAKRALGNTEEAGGAATNAKLDVDSIEKNLEEHAKGARRGFERLGLIAETFTGIGTREPDELEQAGIQALFEERDPTVRAVAMLMGGMPGADTTGLDEFQRKGLETQLSALEADPRHATTLAKARELSAKLEPKQRARTAAKLAKMLGYGAGVDRSKRVDLPTLAANIQQGIEQGIGPEAELFNQTQISYHDAVRTQAGLGGALVAPGAGAGAMTPATTKRLKELGEQDVMLSNMAAQMNAASKALLEAANILKSRNIMEAMPR